MTDAEICRAYRAAKDHGKMIPILADLAAKSKVEIILILIENGETVSKRHITQLYKRMDYIDRKITELEKEYKSIARVMGAKI